MRFSESEHIKDTDQFRGYLTAAFGIFFICLLSCPYHANGLQTGNEEQEVFLSFRYRGLISTVITAYYDPQTEQFYLPTSQLLTLLEIPHQVRNDRFVIEGVFLEPDNRFSINYKDYTGAIGGESHKFKMNDFLIKELDFYATTEVFNTLFEVTFFVDFNNLSLILESDKLLPVEEARDRARKRNRSLQNRETLRESDFPLQYDRRRKLFNGGFLDYGLSSNFNRDDNLYLYNFSIGSEVLGGDLQGSGFGSYTRTASNFRTDDLRWRYVIRNNPYISQIKVGQTFSNGLINRSFTGLQVTDDPIEPRTLFDEYVIEGNSVPQAEVELYSNNVLVGFQEADDLGNYRFVVPLTYGNERYKVVIYRPDGSVEEINKRFQVPFDFLPDKEFDYELNVGRLDDPVLGARREDDLIQGQVSYGITNWLTGSVGGEYLSENFPDPYIYTSVTSRIAESYLVSMDFSPSFLYRVSSSVIYPSSTSLNFSYSNFFGENRPGITTNDEEFTGSIFIPFELLRVPFNFRIFGNHLKRNQNKFTFYRMDLNASLFNRLRLQTGFSDRQVGNFSFRATSQSEITTSLTYLLSRSTNVPRYLRGTFLRAEMSYMPKQNQLEETEFQLSRSLTQTGQVQLSFGRNFFNDFNFLNLTFTLDLNKVRSTSTVRTQSNNFFAIQNFRGSVGFDDTSDKFIFDQREHVGRSATTFRLFIDENNSGTYDPGEKTISGNAISLDKSSRNLLDKKNELLRFTQLQAYTRVNAQIQEAGIPDPLLVPKYEKFSFITDPNQFKNIYIPFYRSGVIEGSVEKVVNDTLSRPLSGLKLNLVQTDGSYKEELQTFSDGSFYGYEIPPGEYELRVDSTQLDFLNATAEPRLHKITVDQVAEGDFKSGIYFKIIPKNRSDDNKKPVITTEESDSDSLLEPGRSFNLQIASYNNLNDAEISVDLAEKLFIRPFTIYFNRSCGLYGVRTRGIESFEKTVEFIVKSNETIFNESAIVNTDQSQIPVDSLYAVQIGTFIDEKKANRFKETFAGNADQPVIVSYFTSENHYKVYIRPVTKASIAKKQLEKIEHLLSESDDYRIITLANEKVHQRYVLFDYSIYVMADKNDLNISEQIKDLTKQPVAKVNIAGFPDKVFYLVEDLPTWSRTLSLYRKMANDYHPHTPFIVLNEKKGSSVSK